MNSLEYHGHTIKWTVERLGQAQLWLARGWIEFHEGETLCSVNFSGTANSFTTEAAAEEEFLALTKNWIDHRLLPKAS